MKNTVICLFFLFARSLASAQVAELDREDRHIPANFGGKSELKRVFEQELQYPDSSLNAKAGGKVELKFTVKADSSVQNIQFVQKVNPQIDKEALRIFKLLRWMPALELLRPKDAETFVVFNFQPSKYKDICKKRGYEKQDPIKEPYDSSGFIYRKVDILPVFQGKDQTLDQFLYENLQYPPDLVNTGISGTVVLSYVVEPTGRITNINVVKPVGGGCDQEAIRVLQLTKWKPGKKKGLLVRTEMTMPFQFRLKTNYR